jgi:hypothetical protein
LLLKRESGAEPRVIGQNKNQGLKEGAEKNVVFAFWEGAQGFSPAKIQQIQWAGSPML